MKSFTARAEHLILSGPHTQPLVTMQRDGFIDQLGEQNVCPHQDAALERAREILAAKTAKKETVVTKPATGLT